MANRFFSLAIPAKPYRAYTVYNIDMSSKLNIVLHLLVLVITVHSKLPAGLQYFIPHAYVAALVYSNDNLFMPPKMSGGSKYCMGLCIT